MRLRAVFYGSIVVGVGLMVAWPWLLARTPQTTLKAFELRVVLYLGALLLSFLACFVSAVFLVRSTRQEAATEARENLRKLTEGTVDDLRRARERKEEDA